MKDITQPSTHLPARWPAAASVIAALLPVTFAAACRTTPPSDPNQEDRPCDQGRCSDGYACDTVTYTCVPVVTCDSVGADGSCGRCGDGLVNGTESCDTKGSSRRCDDDCTPVECGDGKVNPDANEACDDGVNDGTYGGCTSDCQEGPRCGDGITQPEVEACDDGEANSDDWAPTPHCDASCTGPGPACGDAVLDPPYEDCDDGDARNADAWSATATCKTDCSGFAPYCGDGVKDPEHEVCDRGDANGNKWTFSVSTCAASCQSWAPHCGDGILDVGYEACDGGGTAMAGCTAACTTAEAKWSCTKIAPPPEIPGPASPDNACYECGNGIQEPSEECDPGTPASVAHCNADCTAESGFDCVPDPAVVSPGPANPNSKCEVHVDPLLANREWRHLEPVACVAELTAMAFDASGNLYVGRTSGNLGEDAPDFVERWNGSSWSTLGTGVHGGPYPSVNAFAFDSSGNLYVGGRFSIAGGVMAGNIAKWNGSSWAALGVGMNGGVYALAFDAAGSLYAGGEFTTAGGVPASGIAKWDGVSWSALGVGVTGTVRALAYRAPFLYVGGGFVNAGGQAVNHVARWDGVAWSALASGVNGSWPPVRALALDPSGNLYAGGNFASAGVSATNIAKWDGSSWSALGDGLHPVNALAVSGSGTVFAGSESVGGYTSKATMSMWDGASWKPVGGRTDSTVTALAFGPSGVLYAGGPQFSAGLAHACGVAKWNGSSWSALGSAEGGYKIHIASHLEADGRGELYAAGSFSANETLSNRVAKWDGATWVSLGGEMDGGEVATIALDRSGVVYAAGGFMIAGGVPANRVAKWDGSAWSSLDSGMNDSVDELALDSSGNLYAAGFFTTAGGIEATRVAKWNGGTWSALGTGLGCCVEALAADGAGNLYAGGSFTTAGGGPANRIAKWDGLRWSALGDGMDNDVDALAVDASGQLYAGGLFATAGGAAAIHIAKWDGDAWRPLGAGLDRVAEMALDGFGNLYAGGIAKWDGNAWSDVGWPREAHGLAVGSGDLYAIFGGVIVFDLPPVVSLATSAPELSASSPITVTATFSESVTGIDTSDFIMTNGTASNLTMITPGRVWSLEVSPTTDGPMTISLPQDAVQALSDGNGNYASNVLTRTFDIAPTMTSITRTGSAATNAERVDFFVTFSEAVTGVSSTAFLLSTTGSATGNLGTVRFTGSDGVYLVSVTGVAGDGTLRLGVVASSAIVDAAGNALASAYDAGEEYTIDNAPPAAPAVTSTATATSRTPTWTWTSEASGANTFRYQLDAQYQNGWRKTDAASFTPTAPLAVGTHTLYVKERDAAGNWSEPGSHTVTITE